MRAFLLITTCLLACSKKVPPAATGPVPVLACDYHAKVLGGEKHSCTEVRDAAIVESQKAWWGKIHGDWDKVTCTPNVRCPVEGRTAGCAASNGNLEWSYSESAAEVKRVCTLGKFVSTDDMPPPMTFEAFRCAGALVCQETRSVIDMMPTVTATNCQTDDMKFQKGACPTEGVVARCHVSTRDDEQMWSFYPPRTVDDARALCTQIEGTFVDK